LAERKGDEDRVLAAAVRFGTAMLGRSSRVIGMKASPGARDYVGLPIATELKPASKIMSEFAS
jgi:hypothetical protein